MQVSIWVAVAAGAPGLIALVAAGWLWHNVRHLRAGQQVLLPDGATVPLADRQSALQQSMARVERTLDDLEDLVDQQARTTEADLRTALRFQGLVRYDAYRDMGGSQSWSIALLDGNHSGSIITSLHARDHARVYLKQMVEGATEQRLSPEELRAVTLALGGPPGPPPPPREHPPRTARTTPTGEFPAPREGHDPADGTTSTN
ncbi:MAG TPA: DUF4446 family protein [Miltoncostaeaceae bacterium]|nr:DUF4446 family protein [Miltoncostaeaceae bacterium]